MRQGSRERLASLLGILLLPLACADREGGAGERGTARTPDLAADTPVIFLSLDTLRSDRLPAYGYEGVETPAIDTLAADGVLFEHAYTHHPMTLPSHASALTGRLPTEHGIRDNAGYRLGDETETLAEILGRRGYRTGGAVSAFVLDAATGLDAGFEIWEDEIVQSSWGKFGTAQRPGGETLDAIAPWIRQVRREPFLLFLHLYEPHRPWTPPPDLESRYGRTYEGDIAAADRVVDRFLDLLRELDLYERSLIVLFSDHGEGLGDHGEEEHGTLLYRESLQIPLLVKLPGNARAGERIGHAVQLADLVPTVLGRLGLDVPDDLSGRDLFDTDPGDPRRIYAETYFPRLHFGWSELTSMIEYPHHLIQGPDPELYDLERDPEERNDVLRENRRIYSDLREALRDRETELTPPGEVDPETRQRLVALGYLGGTSAVEDEGPRPDPKTRLPVLRDLGRAFDAFEAGRFDRAASGFAAVLEREPGVVDAREYLGHSLLRLHRPDEAREAFERAVRDSGGSPTALLGLAGSLTRLGRLDEAREVAERAAERLPGAWELLAQLAIRQGDLEAAESYVENGLREAGPQPGLRLAEVELLLARGEVEGIPERAAAIESEFPGADPEVLRGLDFFRGQALVRLGREQEAREAFRREIERHPDFLDPYSHLAFVLAVEGRPREAVGVLQRMVETNPRPAAYRMAAETLDLLGDPAGAERVRAMARERWGAAADSGG